MATRQAPIEIKLPGIPPYRLLHIPGGEFMMGSAEDDPDAIHNEKPAHPVHVKEFYLGEFPVTQDLWKAVMGKNPARFQGDRRPVEMVSWDDIVKKFIPALKEKTGETYRLPTEAEWEYAARGGPFWKRETYRFVGSDRLEQVGWYREISGSETMDVGLLLPNTLGLYDMSGNVWEWCADDWHDNYNGAPEDGIAWLGGGAKERAVLRGGSWHVNLQYCRVARRNRDLRFFWNYDSGFRLARGG